MNKPKAIGTAAETAVTRYLVANGFPHAERRTLKGRLDEGDITGCPGLVFEVKGGEAAKSASDRLVAEWLEETETERVNAGADVGVLVLQRRGVGPANAGRWRAVMPLCHVVSSEDYVRRLPEWEALRDAPVWLLLADAVRLLRFAGYGEPLAVEASA